MSRAKPSISKDTIATADIYEAEDLWNLSAINVQVCFVQNFDTAIYLLPMEMSTHVLEVLQETAKSVNRLLVAYRHWPSS